MKNAAIILISLFFSFGLFAQVQAGKFYKIQAKSNQMYFAINGKWNIGAPVLQQKTIGTGGEWQFIAKPGGYYQIKNRASKKFVANFGSQAEAAPIKQTNEPGEGALWKLIPVGGGYFKLKSKFNNKFIANGGAKNHLAPLKQFASVATGGHWKFIKIGSGGQSSNTDKVFIYNDGSYKMEVFKKVGNEEVSQGIVLPSNKLTVSNVKLYDYFSFKPLDQEGNYLGSGYQARPIYIWKLNKEYTVKASNTLSDRQSIIDIQHNIKGVDLSKLDPRAIPNSLNIARVFEDLETNTDADYENAGNYFIKRGFDYNTTRGGKGDGSSRMYYSEESMKKSWSLNVNVDVTGTSYMNNAVGGSQGGAGNIGVGVNKFDNTFSSGKDVFVEKSRWAWNYTITVDPEKAHLSREFKDDVKNLPNNYNKNAYLNFIHKYGTHYSKSLNYGGFYNSFMSMTSATYSKLSGLGVDVKLGASGQQTEYINATSNNDYEEGGSGDATVGFSYNTEEGEKYENSDVTIGYAFAGGNGDFNNWSMANGQETPVAIKVGELSELLIPSVYKGVINANSLQKRKTHLKRAIGEYLASVPRFEESPPPPITYEIELLSTKIVTYRDQDDATHKASGVFEIYGCPDNRIIGLSAETINEDNGETFVGINVPEFSPKKKRNSGESFLTEAALQKGRVTVTADNPNDVRFWIRAIFEEKNSNFGGKPDKLNYMHYAWLNLDKGGSRDNDIQFVSWEKKWGAVQELKFKLTYRLKRIDPFDSVNDLNW